MTENEYIRQLLEKYINDEHTAEELDHLLKLSTEKEGVQNIGDLIEQYFNQGTTIYPEQEERINKILNDADQQVRLISKAKKLKRWNSRWTAVAALLIAALSLSIYLLFYNKPVQTISITATEVKAQQVELPDGSHVWLNTGATLTYPEKFNKDKRTITLSDGQAYFEIAKDENKPFTVDAGTLSVEVLGTSFEVTAYRNSDHASVAVQNGKVNVSAEHTPSTTGTTLTANQKATLNTTTGTIETTDIDAQDIAGWKENHLIFSEDYFSTVIEAMQRRYNVSIINKKPQLQHEKITLRLDDQPVQTAIQILSISSDFKYEFANDSTIIIR